jgi:hypothetical protein
MSIRPVSGPGLAPLPDTSSHPAESQAGGIDGTDERGADQAGLDRILQGSEHAGRNADQNGIGGGVGNAGPQTNFPGSEHADQNGIGSGVGNAGPQTNSPGSESAAQTGGAGNIDHAGPKP